jgi:hypothetical protein
MTVRRRHKSSDVAKDGRIDRRGLCGSIAKVAMMMVILVVVYGTVAYVGFSLFRIGGLG